MNTLINLHSLVDVPQESLIIPLQDQVDVLNRMKKGVSDSLDNEGNYIPSGFPPNQYQINFYEHLIGTNLNLGLDAKAGTGKTTTIESAIRLIRVEKGKKALFLAFNHSIASELKSRFAEKGYNVDVATVHSKGYQAVRNAMDKKASEQGLSASQRRELKSLKVDGSYFKMYIRTNLQTQYEDGDNIKYTYDEINEKFSHIEKFDALQYVNTIVRLGDLGRMFLTSKEEGLTLLSDKYSLDLQADEIQQAAKFLKNYTLEFFSFIPEINGEKQSIDFTDMIWLPNVGAITQNWTSQQYDYVFVDEAQDLSNAQRTLVTKFVKNSGRLIFVGDPNQAIYGFAGADSTSFEKLTKLPNVKILPLNLCYRCGEDIIKLAQKYVPSIESHSCTGKGEVIYGGLIEMLKEGDIVISRLTSPLVSLCLFLIRNRIQATVLGSNIGENLISTVRMSKKKKVDELMEHFWDKYDRLILKLVRTNKADSEEEAMELPAACILEDTIETLQAIASDHIKTTSSLSSEIRRIFSEEEAPITLMTAHRSKGLEADRVFILDWEEHFPHPMAKTPDEKKQEANLQYVAITRAKKTLVFIETPEYWDEVTPPKL